MLPFNQAKVQQPIYHFSDSAIPAVSAVAKDLRHHPLGA